MYLSLAFLSKPLTYTDSLDVMFQLVFPLQVLYRYAYIKITYVHQYGGCVDFYVDCVIYGNKVVLVLGQ